MNNPRKAVLVSWLLLLIISLVPSLSRSQTFDNVGFRKNLPRELRQKFPMCDEFLDVKWIDPKRYIGRVRMDLYTGGVLEKGWASRNSLFFSKRPGRYYAGDEGPVFFQTFKVDRDEYDTPQFDRLVRKAWFGFSRGTVQIHTDPIEYWFKHIKGKEKRIALDLDFDSGGPMFMDATYHSLSYFTKNVCLLLPKEEEVFLVEGKFPFWQADLTDVARKR